MDKNTRCQIIQRHLSRNKGIMFSCNELARTLRLNEYALRKELPQLARVGAISRQVNPSFKVGGPGARFFYLIKETQTNG